MSGGEEREWRYNLLALNSRSSFIKLQPDQRTIVSKSESVELANQLLQERIGVLRNNRKPILITASFSGCVSSRYLLIAMTDRPSLRVSTPDVSPHNGFRNFRSQSFKIQQSSISLDLFGLRSCSVFSSDVRRLL